MAADDAAMRQLLLAIRPFQENRLHEPAAFRCPIARVYIDMLTKEALRTMIGISVPLYGEPALPALEIFNLSLEYLHDAKVKYNLSIANETFNF